MTDLSELLKRVEEATGPDRELDAMLARELDGSDIPTGARWDADSDCFIGGHYGNYTFHEPSHYTDSIDRALALVEKVLRVVFDIHFDPDDVPERRWGISLEGPNGWIETWARSLPLAILAALLRVKIEESTP